MGKKSKYVDKPKTTLKTYKPMVSVCTPTFNRRPFIPIMFDCFRNQTYPKDRIEWIIVDDGTDRIRDLVEEAQRTDIPQIKYFEVDKKMSLGEKRNYMHKHCKGSIIVYMDDDDYYPPERIEHAVEKLMGDKKALCAGSSEMYVYFKHIHKMYQCGPYGPNHATAGTFAFKSRLLDDTSYDNTAALAEEKHFLKNYTIPFVQLDPLKTILVFSHNHNTFDKKKLLNNAHPDFMKVSDKTVDMFIKGEHEAHIKKFFMEDIDAKLAEYTAGEPHMKPDVIEQTKKIEMERNKQMQEEMQKQGSMPVLTIQEPGQPERQLTLSEVVDHLKRFQEENAMMRLKIMQMENMLSNKNMEEGNKNIVEDDNKKYTVKDVENMQTDLRNANIQIIELINEVYELKQQLQSQPQPQPQPQPPNISKSFPLSKAEVQMDTSQRVSVGLPVSATLKPQPIATQTSKSEPEIVVHL